MVTIGLSVSSGIKLLERALMVRVRNINKMAKEAMYSVAPTVSVAKAEAATMLQPLGVARTTMPENRMDFNQTFQHVRFELEALYKQQNPIFSNSAVPELWVSKEKTLNQKAAASGKGIDGTLESDSLSTWEAHTPALWISKTTLPDERLDFNQTFERVRYELEAAYKAQNPIFTTVSKTEDKPTHTLDSALSIPLSADSAPVSRRLETNDRPCLGNRYSARQAMPVA